MNLAIQIFAALWATTQAMAPWLLFGFFAAGVLSLVFSPALVCRFLGKSAEKKAIALAVLLGVPLPLCSCGVLPLAASLKRSGASKGAMAAFLISTPQTGIDSFFATGSLLGWLFALVRPLVASVTGFFGGLFIHLSDNEIAESTADALPPQAEAKGVFKKSLAVLQYGYGTLLKSVAPALLIGLIISALIMVFIPDSFFSASILGNDWVAFPVMLLIGMPMYVCSTASIPVALALMAKGISPGAALIFLIVGPALNGASLTVLLQLLGKKCMAVYLLTIAGAAVLFGFALNLIDATWHLLPDYASTCAACSEASCSIITWLRPGCAIILLLLLAWHLIGRPITSRLTATKTATSLAPEAQLIVVKGMRCDHCRGAVHNLLQAYPSVTEVERIDNETFRVKGNLPETLATDIKKLGFELMQ